MTAAKVQSWYRKQECRYRFFRICDRKRTTSTRSRRQMVTQSSIFHRWQRTAISARATSYVVASRVFVSRRKCVRVRAEGIEFSEARWRRKDDSRLFLSHEYGVYSAESVQDKPKVYNQPMSPSQYGGLPIC